MISVDRIINLVRFKQRDHAKTVYSDYEILECLNECIRHVNQSYALRNADFLETQAILDEVPINEAKDQALAAILGWGRNYGHYWGGMPPEEQREYVHLATTGMELPSDFVTLINVNTVERPARYHPAATGNVLYEDEYRISGGRIYSNAEAIMINYKRRIAEVSETDEIDLPEDFVDLLVKGTGLVLTNADTDVLMAEVNRTLKAIVPARRYSHIKSKMPFMI